MDDELFQLCKSVYEKTGWGHGLTTEKSFSSDGIVFGWMPGNTPLYTSDYLLDKLPAFIIDNEYELSLMKGRKPEYLACYEYIYESRESHDETIYDTLADTSLKALLKLTIALSEAGELS